jgi:hypothetical protein
MISDPQATDAPERKVAAAGAPTGAASGAAEQSFPLIMMFQLATFWAAVAACVDGKALVEALRATGSDPLEEAIVAAAAGVGGALLGFIVGLSQVRRWRSAAVGAFVGFWYGLVILAVYVAPAPLERGLAAAAVIAVTTLAIRIRSA